MNIGIAKLDGAQADPPGQVTDWEARYRELAQEARALLRAAHAEAQPAANITQSLITQHHLDRLAELVQS